MVGKLIGCPTIFLLPRDGLNVPDAAVLVPNRDGRGHFMSQAPFQSAPVVLKTIRPGALWLTASGGHFRCRIRVLLDACVFAWWVTVPRVNVSSENKPTVVSPTKMLVRRRSLWKDAGLYRYGTEFS